MALYATNRFAGDGATTSYEFNFVGKYIARTHVKVYQEDNATKVRTYVSINGSNFLNDTTLRGLPVTPVGSTLVIYRETPKPPLVDFVNGSRFTEYNLDLVARQGLFVAMEALDAGGSEVRQALLETVAAVVDLETAAAASAAIASTRADEVARRNLGSRASPPTTDDYGEPLLTGALYWDTALQGMRSWNGSAWVTLPAATKASVGLPNVDDTSDADKPISSATQTALNGKANTSHTHAVADVTGLQTALNGKANTSHTHAVADVTGLQTALNGKANTSHTHAVADVTGLQTALNGKANTSHTHAVADVTGLQTALDGTVKTTGDQTVSGKKTFASSAVIRNSTPTLLLRNTTHLSSMIHGAGNYFYVLRGGVDSETWTMVNGKWPLTIDLTNNDALFGGNLTAAGNVTAYSDIRLKTDITKITDALSKVSRLSGYTYTRKDTGARQTGVVAQEVQKVLPEAVIDNGEHLAVAYGNIVGLLIEAINELKSEVDQLKGK